MSNAHAVTVDGPTDLSVDELAERKRQAAVDYHTRELVVLKDSLKALQAKGADKDKLANQRQMVADAQAALDAVKEG